MNIIIQLNLNTTIPIFIVGMHLFGREKKVEADSATQMLLKQGVYHVPNSNYDHPFHMDSKLIKKKKVYGFWAAVKYTIILSVLLFWLPPFGQMIAGYVGGRKAGTPMKGLFATLLPVIFVFMIYGLMGMGMGTLTFLDGLWTRGFDAISSVATGIPLIGPIMDFSLHYLGFFSSYIGMGNAWLAPYALTVLFGYAGGVMSLHHKRELKEYEHALEKAIQNMMQTFSQAPVGQAAAVQGVVTQPHTRAQKQSQPSAIPGEQQIGMDGDIPVIMGKKPDGWDEEK